MKIHSLELQQKNSNPRTKSFCLKKLKTENNIYCYISLLVYKYKNKNKNKIFFINMENEILNW